MNKSPYRYYIGDWAPYMPPQVFRIVQYKDNSVIETVSHTTIYKHKASQNYSLDFIPENPRIWKLVSRKTYLSERRKIISTYNPSIQNV